MPSRYKKQEIPEVTRDTLEENYRTVSITLRRVRYKKFHNDPNYTIVFLFDLCSGQPCAGPIWGDRKGTPLHISFRKSIGLVAIEVLEILTLWKSK